MEVVYEIDRKDVVAGQWYMFRNSRASRRLHLFTLAFAILVAWITTPSGSYGLLAKLNAFLGNLLLYAGVWFFWAIIINSWLFRSTIPKKKENGILGEHRVRITKRGFWEETSVNETLSYWRGIDRVEQNEEYIFVFVTPSNMHIIPKRSFSAKEEAEAFYNLAVEYHQSAQENYLPHVQIPN